MTEVARRKKKSKSEIKPKVKAAPKPKRPRKTLSFADIVKRKTPALSILIKDKYISDFFRFIKNNELRAEALLAIQNKIDSDK